MCGSVSGNLRSGSGCGEGCNGVGRGFLPDCALIAANGCRIVSCAHPGAERGVGTGVAGCRIEKGCRGFGG